MKLITVLGLFLMVQSLAGQTTIIWNGEGDAVNWSDVDNWSPSRLPMEGDSVVISGSFVADSVLISDNAIIKNVLLRNGAVLSINVNGSIKSMGSLTYAIRVDASFLRNYGSILVQDVGDNQFADRAIDLLSSSSFENYGNCTIAKTNGYGIRMESGSSVINDGDIDVHSEDRPAIYSGLGVFTNNGNIKTTGITSVSGIAIGSGQFINTGMIEIEVAGVAASGLSVVNVGHFINTGSVEIHASSSAGSINLDGSFSKFDLDDGNIDVNLSNARGLWFLGGELSILVDAYLTVTGTPQDFFLQIDPGVILDCQGVLDLQN